MKQGTMKPLYINFRGSHRAFSWLGRVLLVIAAVVWLDAALTYQNLDKAVREGELRLAQRAPRGAPVKVSPQEIAAARETVERIGMPWDHLFRALESVASDKVALASIEPDAAKGTVTITGDGKDYLAALSYVANLSQTEGLERVQLVRHEQKTNQPNGAVSFSVSAAWSRK